MVSIWTVVLFLLGAAKGKEVCYDPIRCFSDSQPWASTTIRPLNLLPWSPEKIDACFGLYTNENTNNFQILLPSGPSTTEASNFQTDRKTRFITHGFVDKGDESWLVNMCKNMFKVEEVNCVSVDWRKGSQTTYTQAANSVLVVGAQLAWMLATLQSNYTYSPAQFHLIGHSLGAQVLEEAGSRTPGLGRITGWRYGVSVTLSGRTATGQIKVALFGNRGNTHQYDVFK